MRKHNNTGYIILAGGKSSRLGRDKNFETVGNISLLERVMLVISSFDDDIIVATSSGQSFLGLSKYKRVRILTDIFPDKGALGGIYTGLIHSNSSYNLVVASDMPFLNKALLKYMIRLAPGFDAVVPRVGCHVEPLLAVYSKKCIGLTPKM
jgi:molybdopterin-guanine dinucleotide biosynthesis protein A